MGRAIFKTIVLSLLVLATCIGINWFFIPNNPDAYQAAKIDKLELLRRTQSPKVVMIGGSNLAFSFDSEDFSNQFGLPVVNMGLAKSVSLPYLLEESKPYIGDGDVVVLALEYELFYDLYNGSDGLIVELQYVPEGFKHLKTWGQYKTVVEKFGPIMQAKFTGYIRKGTAGLIDDVYRRDGFNKYGDLVTHIDLIPSYEPHELFENNEPFHEESIEVLNQFYLDMLHVGARVVLSAPPLADVEYIRHRKRINELYGRLHKDLSIPIISSPSDYVFPLYDVYDTAYHLLRKGRRMRTQLLINDFNRTDGIGFGGKGDQT